MPNMEEKMGLFTPLYDKEKKVYSSCRKGNKEIRIITQENDMNETGWVIQSYENGRYVNASRFFTDAKQALNFAYDAAVNLSD